MTGRPQFESVTVDILRFVELLWRPGDVREVRIPKYNKYGHTASGYFDSPESLAESAAKWDGKANLYFTLNPVNPALMARASNRIADKAETTSADVDVIRRRSLFIDIDPDRPSGISSTEDERQAARLVLDEVVSFLDNKDWPQPIVAVSGNGWYLLYPISLPNDPSSLELVQGVLVSLATRFNNEAVHIDTTVCNAARLAGLIGSMKVKGDFLTDRPHRRSQLESVPQQLAVISEELLAELAAEQSQPEANLPKDGSIFNGSTPLLEELLQSRHIEYRTQPLDGNDVTWYHVEKCPFHYDECHPFECGVGQKLPDGPYAGKCFHAETEPRGWQEWKVALGLTFSNSANGQSLNPKDKNGPFPLTDAGNAELFAALYGHILRFDHARNRWLIWEEHRWVPDSDGEVRRLAKKAARVRYRTALDIEDLDLRGKTASSAVRSESRQRLDACLALARSEHPIADSGMTWDPDPYLLGVANGVVDLRTGMIRSGHPDDRLTMQVPVQYHVKAECPRWQQFLHQVFQRDGELIGFVQRALGYSLTGSVREQVLFLCYGTGSNGKSVFLDMLRNVLGDYAMNIPFTVLELQQRPSLTNDLASMAGRRLVTSSETNESTRLNEARIKALTGGDPITARFLYSESFTYEPVAKFWLAVNHLPRVRDDSYGFWRRVRVLPFNEQFTGDDADKGLPFKLLEELPGILNWGVQGALNWRLVGLAPPSAVMTATQAYRKDNDELDGFVADCCVVADGVRAEPGHLFSEYQRWSKEQGILERHRLGSRSFGTRIRERFGDSVSSNGKRYFLGIGLKANQ